MAKKTAAKPAPELTEKEWAKYLAKDLAQIRKEHTLLTVRIAGFDVGHRCRLCGATEFTAGFAVYENGEPGLAIDESAAVCPACMDRHGKAVVVRYYQMMVRGFEKDRKMAKETLRRRDAEESLNMWCHFLALAEAGKCSFPAIIPPAAAFLAETEVA
jgi:hypothetical protein